MTRNPVERIASADGTIEAGILPGVGARLHRLRAFGHEVLRTPEDPGTHARDPFSWGAFVMAPWCNRLDAGTTVIGPRRVTLESNFSDGTAIHGQVYARRWERQDEGTFSVTGGGDGWPWPYEVRLHLGVAGTTLRIGQSLTNLADVQMPAGLGLHPWFRSPVLVAIRAGAVHPDNMTSDGRPQPVRDRFDLREMGTMAVGLDGAWTDLEDPAVELRWPTAGIRATMRISAPSVYVVAASPADIDAVAIEPETHAPHGIRRMLNGEPGGLTLLEPGQTLALGIELGFERIGHGT